MGIVPTKIQDLLSFCSQHANIWTENQSGIGITPAQLTAYKNKFTAADTAVSNQIAAEGAKKTATLVSQAAVAQLRESVAETIAIIKAFADASANPSAVYGLAEIPMPAAPSPAPPPGTPKDFVATINQSGFVTLKWKCENPEGISGTIYQVSRRTGANTNPFTFIGATGTRSFTDATLPAGSTGVTYSVTAVRSTLTGEPAEFNVNFGVGGGGGMFIASTSEGTPSMKMAA